MAATIVKLDARPWLNFIDRLHILLKNPQPILRAAFATVGFRDIIKHFQEEKGSEGKWKKRSASTQAAYKRLGKKNRTFNPSNKLLQLTGDLRKAFLPGNIENKGRDAILFFNPTPYAAVHDKGSKKQGIPQRDFMYLSEKAQDKMLDVILDRFLK